MSNLAKFQIFAAAQLDANRSFSFQGGASAARTPRATDAFRTKTLGRCGTILHRLLLRPILNRSAVGEFGYFPNCRITVKPYSPNRDWPASESEWGTGPSGHWQGVSGRTSLDGSAGFHEGFQQPFGFTPSKGRQSTATLAMLSHPAVLLFIHFDQILLPGAHKHPDLSPHMVTRPDEPVMPPQSLSLGESEVESNCNVASRRVEQGSHCALFRGALSDGPRWHIREQRAKPLSYCQMRDHRIA
jgi:hypothetical protein